MINRLNKWVLCIVLLIAGGLVCGRWCTNPLIEWGDYDCIVQIHDALIQLRFYKKRGGSHSLMADVDTRASVYSRYIIKVLSAEYLFFKSSDIGSFMFLFDDKGVICKFPAICMGKKKQVYCIYKGAENVSSYVFHEVIVLCLDNADRIRKYVLRGRFTIAYPDFDIDDCGRLICNGCSVEVKPEITIQSVEDKLIDTPPAHYENGILRKSRR